MVLFRGNFVSDICAVASGYLHTHLFSTPKRTFGYQGNPGSMKTKVSHSTVLLACTVLGYVEGGLGSGGEGLVMVVVKLP